MSNAIKIGLEIHCQLTGLQSKLFCSCSADYRGKLPNENICPICYGLPGTLPLLNQKAVEFAGMISIALDCLIPAQTMFYRKNYFYLDLPKNFQLTQYDTYGKSSIGSGGKLSYGSKTIRIRRVQLEEDPGRLIYEEGNTQANLYTLIDYNRSGVALVEIVTEPDFEDPKDARTFLNKIGSIVEHLGVCDTKLEGAIRCDANISIDEGKRVEIKNVGSFRELERALSYEITRQKSMSLRSIEIKGETRHWDDSRKVTKKSRTKEEEQDYRYLPEADIPTVIFEREFLLSLKAKMPELPYDRKTRFISSYQLSEQVAQVLIDKKELADFFESAIKAYSSAKEIANWIVNDLMWHMDDAGDGRSLFANLKIEPNHIAKLAKMVDQNIISRNTAKTILSQIIRTGEDPSYVAEKNKVSKIDDKIVISTAIERVFDSEKTAVDDAKMNPNATNYLLGKVMQLTGGRADPGIASQLIKKRLNQSE